MFLTIDGLDGAGKSTQLDLLQQWLAEQGKEVVVCRDPGSTRLGERIRDLLLAHDEQTLIGRRAEMLLYMAARAQLVEEVIRPALAAGKCVLADRYLLANVVYQGHAGGLDVDALWEIGYVATAGVMPDLTLVLDLTPEKAARRMKRQLDRMETQDETFRQNLRAGFLREAQRHPQRIVVIDASAAIDAVAAEIRVHVDSLISRIRDAHSGG